MDQKSVKIEVWWAPGQVWRPLGPSWAIQRIFEGILDRLGGVLEASWAGKVANMAPTWPQVGSQVGAKMDKKIHPKIDQKIDGSWDRFLEGFWWILGGKMEPSWHQNGIKNRFLRKHEKTHLELAR